MSFQYRNEKGQFISETAALIADLTFFVSEWKRWAVEAMRKGDREECLRCKTEMNDCRRKLNALKA